MVVANKNCSVGDYSSRDVFKFYLKLQNVSCQEYTKCRNRKLNKKCTKVHRLYKLSQPFKLKLYKQRKYIKRKSPTQIKNEKNKKILELLDNKNLCGLEIKLSQIKDIGYGVWTTKEYTIGK